VYSRSWTTMQLAKPPDSTQQMIHYTVKTPIFTDITYNIIHQNESILKNH